MKDYETQWICPDRISTDKLSGLFTKSQVEVADMMELLVLITIIALLFNILVSIFRLKILKQDRKLVSLQIDYYIRKMECDEKIVDYLIEDRE